MNRWIYSQMGAAAFSAGLWARILGCLAAVPTGLAEYVGDHLSLNMIEHFLSDFLERQRVRLGTVFEIEVDQFTVNQRRDVSGIAVPGIALVLSGLKQLVGTIDPLGPQGACPWQ